MTIIFHPGVMEERNGRWVQIGRKCSSCGKTSFPVTELCPFCSSENGQMVSLSRMGTLFSFSITRVPVGPYKPPIVAGFIDLPEGTRIFGQIHAAPDEIKTGMLMTMKTGVLWTEKDGTEVMGYYYEPIKTDVGGAE